MPQAKSAPSKKRKGGEVKEMAVGVAPVIDIEETEVAPVVIEAAVVEEEEAPSVEAENDLFATDEVGLDEEDLNPFGDKWEE